MKRSIRYLFLLTFLLHGLLARAELPVFVSTEWLAQHLRDDDLYLADLSDGMQYLRFHLPGARQVQYGWLIRPRNGLALSGGPEYMRQVLSQLGITPETTVILYDDTAGLNAARLYWELKKLDHANVAILNGGSVAWILEQRPVTQTPTRPGPPRTYPAPERDLTTAYTASREEVRAAIEDPKTLLIDVRSREEYEGHPREPRSGHIPTAVHFEWIEAVALENKFMEKDRDTLLKQLAQLGLKDSTQPVILYCRTGHRAARMFATLRHLGFENVKIYDGSIQEWQKDPRLPLKKGPNP